MHHFQPGRIQARKRALVYRYFWEYNFELDATIIRETASGCLAYGGLGIITYRFAAEKSKRYREGGRRVVVEPKDLEFFNSIPD